MKPRMRMLVLSVAAIAGPISAHPQDFHLVTREESLGPRRPRIVEHTLSVSAANRLAYVVKTPQGEAVVMAGKQQATYASIPRVGLSEAGITAPLVFSPDGERIAYVAVTGSHSMVVVDGVNGPPFDRISVGAPTFSPDSRRVAYIARRGGKELVVVDGVEGPMYDQIDRMKPGFTTDSKHVFYSGRRADHGYAVVDGHESGGAEFIGDVTVDDTSGRIAYALKRQDSWAIVVDGVEGKAYRDIGNNLVFSRDGRHFLYRAGDVKDHVIVDGVESPGFGSISENSYAFSADGRHVAFAALDRTGRFWVLDGKRGESFEWVSTQPELSPDGRRLTYVAEMAGKRFVVIGDQRGAPFDDITTFPRFAADGRVIYVAKRGPRMYVGVDSIATPFDAVENAFITTAGKLVVVARRDSTWTAIIDGVESRKYDTPVGPFATSPDGQRIAYAVRRGTKQLVTLDGVEGRLYDEVGTPEFSPDGRHVIYTATRAGGSLVVVDSAESPVYEEILSLVLPTMAKPASLGMLARRGTADFRVTLEWTAPGTTDKR